MSRRRHIAGIAVIAAAFIAALTVVAVQAGASPGATVRHARIVERAAPRPLVPEARSTSVSWATSLEQVDVRMRNTGARAKIRLYADDGSVDDRALGTFVDVAASAEGAHEPLPPRLVQLVFRAAYHFKGAQVVIVSATRKGARGKHGHGEAIDFHLVGVRASTLAAFLRRQPRAGVGIYTHPKTQYVHLDVRERSFHWLDGSPPGVSWREKRIGDPKGDARDAAYVPAMDLPETALRRPR